MSRRRAVLTSPLPFQQPPHPGDRVREFLFRKILKTLLAYFTGDPHVPNAPVYLIGPAQVVVFLKWRFLKWRD